MRGVTGGLRSPLFLPADNCLQTSTNEREETKLTSQCRSCFRGVQLRRQNGKRCFFHKGLQGPDIAAAENSAHVAEARLAQPAPSWGSETRTRQGLLQPGPVKGGPGILNLSERRYCWHLNELALTEYVSMAERISSSRKASRANI